MNAPMFRVYIWHRSNWDHLRGVGVPSQSVHGHIHHSQTSVVTLVMCTPFTSLVVLFHKYPKTYVMVNGFYCVDYNTHYVS
jgi:hypothetical protein